MARIGVTERLTKTGWATSASIMRGLVREATEAFDLAIDYAGEGNPNVMESERIRLTRVKKDVLRELGRLRRLDRILEDLTSSLDRETLR